MFHFESVFSSQSPRAIQATKTELCRYREEKVYTTTVETLLFSFSGSGASMVYTIPFFPDLWCIPLSLVFPRKWYTP